MNHLNSVKWGKQCLPCRVVTRLGKRVVEIVAQDKYSEFCSVTISDLG